jgi:hypothetical protein
MATEQDGLILYFPAEDRLTKARNKRHGRGQFQRFQPKGAPTRLVAMMSHLFWRGPLRLGASIGHQIEQRRIHGVDTIEVDQGPGVKLIRLDPPGINQLIAFGVREFAVAARLPDGS